jgi:hypothetical protein
MEELIIYLQTHHANAQTVPTTKVDPTIYYKYQEWFTSQSFSPKKLIERLSQTDLGILETSNLSIKVGDLWWFNGLNHPYLILKQNKFGWVAVQLSSQKKNCSIHIEVISRFVHKPSYITSNVGVFTEKSLSEQAKLIGVWEGKKLTLNKIYRELLRQLR